MRVTHIIEPGVTNTQWVEIINFCNSILKLNLFGFLATSVDGILLGDKNATSLSFNITYFYFTKMISTHCVFVTPGSMM